MNLIANPIGPRVLGGPLIVIFVERYERRHFMNHGPVRPYCSTREKLELVYFGEIKRGYCNTHPDQASSECSLTATRQRIASGAVDLVVARDLRQISDWLDEVLSFVRHCVDRGTRAIAFEDGFDSADPDWEQSLFDDFFDDSGRSGRSE